MGECLLRARPAGAQPPQWLPAYPHGLVQGLELIGQMASSPELQLSADLEPGDIQVLHNWTQLHRRDNYEDHEVRAGWPQAANCHGDESHASPRPHSAGL